MKTDNRIIAVVVSLLFTCLTIQAIMAADLIPSLSGNWKVRSWNDQLNAKQLNNGVTTNGEIIYIEGDLNGTLTNITSSTNNFGYALTNVGTKTFPALLTPPKRYIAGSCFYPRHAVEVRNDGTTNGPVNTYFEVCFECVNIKAWTNAVTFTTNNNATNTNYRLQAVTDLTNTAVDFSELAKLITDNARAGTFTNVTNLQTHLNKYLRETNN